LGAVLSRVRFEGVYGIPTGGAVVALILSQKLHLPILDIPTPGCLIVDDICDSGRTLQEWYSAGYMTAVLHVRPQRRDPPTYFVEETEDWIAYPYERASVGEDIVTRMIELIGEDPARPGLRETPARVVRSWGELFAGYHADPTLTSFEDPCDQMVVVRGIEFTSTCEHHLLPFVGMANVAYVPNGRVLGLSKIPRLVEVYARRLQLQERLTGQVADAIEQACQPKGVAVVLSARHLCVSARGVGKQQSDFVTSAMRGCFLTEGAARAEFFSLIDKGGPNGRG